MSHNAYDDIVYTHMVASTHGKRGALAETPPDDEAEMRIRELTRLGARKVAAVDAVKEQRIEDLRRELAEQRGDLRADACALEHAEPGLQPADLDAQHDRFAWSPLRAAMTAFLLGVLAALVLLVPSRDDLLRGVVPVLATALGIALALIAGRAFGKALERRPYARVVLLGGFATVIVIVAALTAHQRLLAATAGLAAIAGAFVLGWLAGRHDHVLPRQQRVQRVEALRSNVAAYGGAIAALEERVACEYRHAAAAVAAIEAATVSACAIAASTADTAADAHRLLAEAEALVAAWEVAR